MRLKTQRVRMVPPIPHTIIVTPNVKLSMAFTPQNDYEFSGSRLYLNLEDGATIPFLQPPYRFSALYEPWSSVPGQRQEDHKFEARNSNDSNKTVS
jgi:hypothetical protein